VGERGYVRDHGSGHDLPGMHGPVCPWQVFHRGDLRAELVNRAYDQIWVLHWSFSVCHPNYAIPFLSNEKRVRTVIFSDELRHIPGNQLAALRRVFAACQSDARRPHIGSQIWAKSCTYIGK
jgi:hypothetical protein